MKKMLLAAAFSVMALPAIAGQCPADMGKIDAAMANNPDLTAEQMAEVKELRAEGEALHQSGDHAASVEALAKAKMMLGIE